MRKIIAASLLVAVAVCDYAPVFKYAADMPCQECVRGGYNFCVYGTVNGGGSRNVANCSETDLTPNVNFPNAGMPNGYVCSRGIDETSAIVAGCMPRAAQEQVGNICGEYFIDLTSQTTIDARKIPKFPVGNSCTYRVYSKCGYPAAYLRVLNPNITQDYDIFYSYQTGFTQTEDFDADWVTFDKTTDSKSAFQSGTDAALDFISEGFNNDEVPKAEYDKCASKNRNLYINIIRVKDSTPKLTEEHLVEGRVLQTLYNDLELGFVAIQGGKDSATFLGAISLALLAVLSVFAF